MKNKTHEKNPINYNYAICSNYITKLRKQKLIFHYLQKEFMF